MAIDPSASFPGRTDNTSDPVGYPLGKAKDQTTPGNGTPFVAVLLNDIFGFQQALLDAAGLTASGTPDKVGASQYLAAVQAVAAAAGGAGGRLVKFLTASSTLTIDNGADDTVAAYLTSNLIKAGTYLVVTYGAGGGGAGNTGNGSPQGGGGGGGVSRDILALTVNTAYTIGAGGAGSSGAGDGSAGGTTTLSTVTSGGGGGGFESGSPGWGAGGIGGTGTLMKGGPGQPGEIGATNGVGGPGGGPAGGDSSDLPIATGDGGLASGGAGAGRQGGDGLDGGDGYIEIWEWS